MGLLRSIGTFARPRKIEFIKRLIAKRKECATDPFGARAIPSGTTQAQLWNHGLSSVSFIATPEATIVNILEQYWLPRVHGFYSIRQSLSAIASEAERKAEERERMEHWVAHIEYLLTGKPDAAKFLPRGLSLLTYIRYRIGLEHPENPYVRQQDGFTDEFIAYAVDESKYVFGR